jgi:hypothetical protein
MRRKFKVTVQFNLNKPEVVDCIMQNFDFKEMSDDGIVEITYTTKGNKNSSEETAIRGMKQYLNWWDDFKRGYKILSAREITE